MLFSFTKVLLYLLVSCVFVGAALNASFVIEREHGQLAMPYTGVFLMFCIRALPLNVLNQSSASEWCDHRCH
jgi:hypothetical protein